MKKNLNDWDRPARSTNYHPEGWDRPYYDYVFLTEGQKYRYNLLIPRLINLVGKHGFNKTIKLLGRDIFVKTFIRNPEEFMEIFNRHNMREFSVLLPNNQGYSYGVMENSAYIFKNSVICLIDRNGVLKIDESLHHLFRYGFGMPDRYLYTFLKNWCQIYLNERITKVHSTSDLCQLVDIKKIDVRNPLNEDFRNDYNFVY